MIFRHYIRISLLGKLYSKIIWLFLSLFFYFFLFLNLEQIYLLTLYCGPDQLNLYCGLKLMKFQAEVLVKNT